MKKALFTLLTACFYVTTFGQTADTISKPTFNCMPITEEKMDDFELTTKYYTIENNISNKNSLVYVSEKPSSAEYLQFAMTHPSYFFVIHKGAEIKLEITLLQKKEKEVITFAYVIVNPGTGNRLEVSSRVSGQITEGRVQELEKLRLDRTSRITDLPDGKRYTFNNVWYTIQPFDQVKAEMLGLVKSVMTGMESARD